MTATITTALTSVTVDNKVDIMDKEVSIALLCSALLCSALLCCSTVTFYTNSSFSGCCFVGQQIHNECSEERCKSEK
jgi:hypothetical protein